MVIEICFQPIITYIGRFLNILVINKSIKNDIHFFFLAQGLWIHWGVAVLGGFEDVSEDLERTIKAIAKSRETGQPAVSEARSGWILGQYKRLLS